MNNKENVKRGNALFLAIVVAYLILNIGIGLVANIFNISFTYIQLILIAQIGYALPAIVYAFNKKQPIRSQIRFKKVNVLSVVMLIIFAFAIQPLMTLLNALSLLIGENTISSTVTGMLDQTSFIFCWLAIGVLPAILEEFVYRGVIYNEQRKGNAIKAILCSGLFFGLLHMNINQFSYAFVMGIILALVVEATGSIVSSMIVHATINSFSVVITKIQPYLLDYLAKMQEKLGQEVEKVDTTLTRSDIISALPSYVVSAVFATAFAAFIYFLLVKYNERQAEVKAIFCCSQEEKQERKQAPFADVFFILAVTICVVVMLLLEFAQ